MLERQSYIIMIPNLTDYAYSCNGHFCSPFTAHVTLYSSWTVIDQTCTIGIQRAMKLLLSRWTNIRVQNGNEPSNH